jgi:hypothetical protein
MSTVQLVRADEFGTQPGEPCVGVLWLATQASGEHVLIVSRTLLSGAETYGDCLTDPRGHAELWESWNKVARNQPARFGIPPAITVTEYDDHPRGRVIYHRPTQQFWVFIDPRLHRGHIIQQIVRTFRIPRRKFWIRWDEHYRCGGRP